MAGSTVKVDYVNAADPETISMACDFGVTGIVLR
jgi:hypothetical protein